MFAAACMKKTFHGRLSALRPETHIIFQMASVREQVSWVTEDPRRWPRTRPKSLASDRGGEPGQRYHESLYGPERQGPSGRDGGGWPALPASRRPWISRDGGLNGLPGGTGTHHRRPHAPVRQNLSHPGLRRLYRHAQNGGSGLKTLTSTCLTYSRGVRGFRVISVTTTVKVRERNAPLRQGRGCAPVAGSAPKVCPVGVPE